MQPLKKITHWFDTSALLITTAFLFAFIPLFPKIPLFDVLPGYIVRARAEDILVFITAIIWFVQVLRKKIAWKTPLTFLILLYILVGFISILFGLFLTTTIPPQLIHIGKSGLHLFRYIEYFLLFFFTFSAIKKRSDVKLFLIVLATTVLAIAVYGAGQKYLHWPLYSTMNREYSKGEALYLNEFARVQSTFAGHYDLTAYLVLVLPLLFAVLLSTKSNRAKIGLIAAQIAGVWLLIAGSSKSSLAAYGVTIAIVLFFKFKETHRSVTTILKWATLSLLGGITIVFGVLFIAPDFYRSLAVLSKTVPPVHAIVLKIDAKLPVNSPLKLPGENRSPEGNLKPDDVYIDVPDLVQIAITDPETGVTTYRLVEKERTWSENALKYGLSMGIRLDTLWPLALKGFMKNPLTGSGYATLTKGDTTVYTEADSTDNNYLRVLGETGLLGFILFFGSVFYLLKTAYRTTTATDSLIKTLNIGFIAGTVGLLLNALTIDVFAASKVAFTFWSLSGIILASYYIAHPVQAQTKAVDLGRSLKKYVTKYGVLLLFGTCFFFLVYQNPFAERSAVLNFAANPSGAEHIAAARCFLRTGTVELCRGSAVYPARLDLYAILLLPLLKIYNNPGIYFVFNLTLSLTSLWMFTQLLKKISKHAFIRTTALVLLISSQAFITAVSTPSAGIFLLFLLLLTLPLTQRSRAITLFGAIATGVVALLVADTTAALIALLILGFAFALEWLYQKFEHQKGLTHLFIPMLKVGTVTLASILFTFTYLSRTTLETTLQNFRSTQPNWRYTAVSQINDFFYENTVGENPFFDPTKTPYLITAMNPYYVDMFSNGMYTLLPLSKEQTYMDHPNSVWEEDHSYKNLTALYHQILASNSLFASNFDLDANTTPSFSALHTEFDLDIIRLGCNYTCILYQVREQLPFTSPTPKTINAPLQLETLPEDYRFTVASTRFSFAENLSVHSLSALVSAYKQVGKEAEFSVITGDILYNYDQEQIDALSQLYLETPEAPPTLFAPGNFDLLPQKKFETAYHHFYTPEDYFLFISTNQKGETTQLQQHYILNQILDLEKMDTISTVFIFIDRANWVGYDANLQSMSQMSISNSPSSADSFMIQQVLPRLEKLPSKNIYIISGDMKPNQSAAQFSYQKEGSNITFLASGLSNTTGDRFIEFSKNAAKWSYSFKKVE